jgi:hypothetical protein
MPDTVIDRVSELGSGNFCFSDRRGRRIGDSHVPALTADKITGVDDTDVLNNTKDIVVPDAEPITGVLEDKHAMDDFADPTADVGPTDLPDVPNDTKLEPEPVSPDVAPVPTPTSEQPADALHGLCHSARVSIKPTAYVPSFGGKSYGMTQHVLHPNAHMSFFQQEGPTEPDVVAAASHDSSVSQSRIAALGRQS